VGGCAPQRISGGLTRAENQRKDAKTPRRKTAAERSQRDFVLQPRVAQLPWVNHAEPIKPQRGFGRCVMHADSTPLGLWSIGFRTPGSSCLPPSRRPIAPLRRDGGATLGWRLESLWDSPKRISAAHSKENGDATSEETPRFRQVRGMCSTRVRTRKPRAAVVPSGISDGLTGSENQRKDAKTPRRKPAAEKS
jgi:hypothetical protein